MNGRFGAVPPRSHITGLTCRRPHLPLFVTDPRSSSLKGVWSPALAMGDDPHWAVCSEMDRNWRAQFLAMESRYVCACADL